MVTWNSDKLETVACDYCGSTDAAEVITRPDGLTVCECGRCGLAYLNPPPTAECVAELYTADYFANELPSNGAVPQSTSAAIGYSSYSDRAETLLRSKIMQTRRDWVLSLCQASAPRILEIGCATGEFASAVHAQGHAITAIDISSDVIEMARGRYPGIDFRATSVEQLAQSGEEFDAIVAFEVIEHVLSPRKFLTACSDLLAPGGVLVYSTPNYRTARVLKKNWVGYATSFEHLYFFSDETLARLGRAAGLDAVEWKTTGAGTLPNTGARGRLKQIATASGLLPLARTVRARWQVLGGGENYVPFGSGHTLLMAFRKPGPVATMKRAA